ncbi:MAG: hypothetical protein HY343_06700 [Lentisphaerae bacterium]|nr:hypothetical protein [Lentisphaerota bacterium]
MKKNTKSLMTTLGIQEPVAYQIVQRQGFEPAMAHEHGNTAARGRGLFPVRLKSAPPAKTLLQYRAVPLKNAFGQGVEWTPFEVPTDPVACVPAGGWYRLEIRAWANDTVQAFGSVEPVGVGEVFLIAGQSYADNCNDELLRVGDPEGRVAAYDPATGQWRIAHDPQPTPSGHRDGSLWPILGDMLLSMARVPIGFVNVAVGGTASSTWLPGQTNYRNLVKAGKAIGRFRHVLWQQGESDVIGGVSTATYAGNITAIRKASAREWGFQPPWLLAKSTLHPMVYNNPAGEQKIRQAIARLWARKGFAPGPDTDILGGDHRGGPESRRHFSPQGQRAAGLLWFSSVWTALHARRRGD